MQVAEAVSISQQILGFIGVTEDEVLGRVQQGQAWWKKQSKSESKVESEDRKSQRKAVSSKYFGRTQFKKVLNQTFKNYIQFYFVFALG